MLSKILTHITALENENKILKAELKINHQFQVQEINSEQESDSDTKAEVREKDILHKDCKTKEDVSHEDCMIKDASHEGCKFNDNLPIPKSVNFTNLHSKLNLEKNVYQSYKTAFYNLVDRHTSAEVQYKNLDKKTKAGIICKFKKDNPHFSNCIGDWTLIYLMHHKINFNRDNICHQNTNKSNDEARNSECEDHEKQNDHDELVLRNSTKFNKLDEQMNSSVKSTPQPTLHRSSRKRTNVEKRPIDENNNSSKSAKK
ncbi:hypothetical protein C1645_834194 [Glomus cerebriforme]|uniref:Uncharacterized protein n=1 Tax=Glomus cerebriforme TaxID=658196 RepID=A0A397SA46_9GLOM|nr:hypothetical protein C1645_834194 [Glomus cerebriforme]